MTRFVSRRVQGVSKNVRKKKEEMEIVLGTRMDSFFFSVLRLTRSPSVCFAFSSILINFFPLNESFFDALLLFANFLKNWSNSEEFTKI